MTIPEDIMREARAIVQPTCGCAPGRRRNNGTSHHDSCNYHVLAIARALHARDIAAEKRGAERAAKVAERDADWVSFGKRDIQPWENGPDDARDYRIGIVAGRAIAAAIRRGEG